MVVIVRREDGTAFQTVAYAIIYGKAWDSEYFVMNERSEFERVYAFRQGVDEIIPQVIPVDVFRYADGWLKEKKGEGYKEFLHNPKLLEGIRQGKKGLFDWETMAFWQSLFAACGGEVDYGPIPVDEEEPKENLMEFAGHFHDAVVADYQFDEDRKEAVLTLSGVWGIPVLRLIFKGVKEFRLVKEWQDDYFLGANVFFPKEGGVAFVSGEDIDALEKCRGERLNLTYVWAGNMSYSFELEKSPKRP